jgi:uncharacterized membrane protein|tara:strand:+ start:1933 stop:3057 length:1125 start_codon:yes stop_codon:yes gene_type:complete
MIPVLIISFTVISVFFLDRWENKHIKAIFNWVPAILLAYLIPAAISMLIGEDFAAADIHRFSKTYFIPFAIIAVMSSLSINQLKSIGWKPIAVFVIGSFWIAVFPIMLAFVLLDTSFVANLLIHQEYWKGLPPIVGSWIGGSTSQLVLKELVECPENIFLTVLVIDNVLVNIWTILMFQGIKKTDSLNRFFKISNIAMPENIEEQKGEKIHPVFIFLVLLSSILLVNNFIESFIIKVIAVSIIGLLFSNLIKKWNINFALRIGSILILLVMAILGLKLKFSAMEFDIAFLGFLVVWLISHVVIMLIAAKLLNVSIAWVPIASMANVGGIATAPAVTAAYEKKWMPHAILLAILSMATGTLWGLVTIFLFKTFLL